MNKRHLQILCAVLVLIGVVVTGYRWLALEFPLTPRETTPTWRIEARITFEARGVPTKATLMVPQSSPGLTLFDESLFLLWSKNLKHQRFHLFKGNYFTCCVFKLSEKTQLGNLADF